MARNKPGRPKKADRDKRTHQVLIRLSPNELEKLDALTDTLRISRAEVIRRAIDSTRLSEPVSAENISHWAALGQLGSNLNQCVRALNAIKGMLRHQMDSGHVDVSEFDRWVDIAREANDQLEPMMQQLALLRAILIDRWDGVVRFAAPKTGDKA